MIIKNILNENRLMQFFIFIQTFIISLFLVMCGIPASIALVTSIIATRSILKRYYKHESKQTYHANIVKIDTKEHVEHFKSKGLNSNDMVYFKKVMDEANEIIYRIKNQIAGVRNLEKALLTNNTLETIDELYKDIVNEPERLHDVNKFLYVHLPTLDQLITEYVQIYNHHKISDHGNRILKETITTIEEVSVRIDEDYLQFRDKDIKSLENSIQTTRKRLNIEDVE